MSVIVLGSANLDRVYEVHRIPRPGETLLASNFAQYPGGKGNNQAIAAARAGASTTLIATLGTDAPAEVLTKGLRQAHVKGAIRRVATPTGTALITVDKSAENTIVVHSGANARMVDLTGDELAALAESDLLLLQLEVPIETVIAGAQAARAANTKVVLNASPVRVLPMTLLDNVDLLLVNEHEASLVSQSHLAEPVEASDVTVEGALRLSQELLRLVPAVVITLGKLGAVVQTAGMEAVHVPGHRVAAVDTTGAGDTFCGALAAALDQNVGEWDGNRLVSAARFATAAAAISVQRTGAVPSIPTRKEITHFYSSSSS